MATDKRLFNIYPNPLVNNAEKDSEAYGVSIGYFIFSEWLYGDNNSRFIRRKEKMSYLEGLRKNEVDINKFKDILGMNQDKAWTAIDWSFVPIIPKFVDSIVDGFAVDLFKVKAKGVDYVSQKERTLYKKTLETEMLTKDLMVQYSRDLGMDLTPQHDVPDTYEELDLHMELNYQQDKEIAAEICIDKTLELNFWKETFNHIIQDIVTFRIGAVRNKVDREKGIVQRYVNPKHLIYSYDPDHTRDKRGCYYFAEVRIITVEELNRDCNGKFSEEELKAMANNYTGRLGNAAEVKEYNYYEFNIEVIDFCWKTTRNEVYKKKYKNVVEKPDDWQLHPDSKSKRLSGTYEVWYEGTYIPYTEKIYNYRLMKDMVRPNSNINRVLPPYSVYELNTPSMVERMEKFANEIQITMLKLQQLIATAKPQGAMIDIDALNDLNLGTGGLLEPIEVVDIYNQRGDLLWSSKNYEGDRVTIPPIQELKNGIGSDLQQLVNYYNHNIQMIYDVTGLNRVRDGSSPQPGALVGTQRIALAMSNNATKNILNGALTILKNTSEVIISRVQQMALYGEQLNKGIKSVLGERNVEVLQEGKKLHLYEFSITIQTEMDEEERQDFNRYVELAVQSQAITIPDVIDLKATKNLKLAGQYLKIKIERRQKEMQQIQERQIQVQEQARAQAQIAVQQADAEAQQNKMQIDQQRVQFETQAKAMLMGKQAEFDVMMENLKHQHAMQLKSLEVQANTELNKFKEDSKDFRTAKQASQQSRMIAQREQNGMPIDFESEDQMKQMMQQQGMGMGMGMPGMGMAPPPPQPGQPPGAIPETPETQTTSPELGE